MRSTFQATTLVLLCGLLFAGAAKAEQTRLGGQIVQFSIPEGYSMIRDAAYPELREFLKDFTDFGKGDVLAFRLDDVADPGDGALPRYLAYVAAAETKGMGRAEFDLLMKEAVAQLTKSPCPLGEGASQGLAVTMSDVVWNWDAQLNALSLSLAGAELPPSTPGTAVTISVIYGGDVLYVLQIGDAASLDGYNSFIRDCAANILAVGLRQAF